MARLSVNINKLATLRNARGGKVPDLLEGVDAIVAAGAAGITVHPRADERHITRQDTQAVADHLRHNHPGIEYNVEGDPRPDWIELVAAVRPAQATLVPVVPGEVTSQAGWSEELGRARVAGDVQRLRALGIRTSVFVEPDDAAIEWASSIRADRIELYTEPFARAVARGDFRDCLERYVAASRRASELGLGVNAGHDLDEGNLPVLVAALPRLDEVSIGHALISRAVFDGLGPVVARYVGLAAGSAED